MEWPHPPRKVDVWVLDCPTGNAECRKHYDSSSEGVFLYSTSTAIALRPLYQSYSFFLDAGIAPATFHRMLAGDNNAMQSWAACQEEFFAGYDIPMVSENTFRKAFIAFAYHVGNSNVVYKCSCCGDSPEVVVIDGTMVALRSSYTNITPITTPDTTCVIPAPSHKRVDRAFVNGDSYEHEDGGVVPRREVQRLLRDFGSSIKPWEGRPPLSGTDEAKLLAVADDYELLPFLTWAKTQTQRPATQRNVVGDFIRRCLASDSPVLSYFPWSLIEPVKNALPEPGNQLSCELLEQIAREAPVLFGVLEVAGAKENQPFHVGIEFDKLLIELCERSRLCGEGPGLHDIAGEGPQPSVETDECILTGVACGLPKLRSRPLFAADQKFEKAPTDCKHDFVAVKDKTGGIITVFCKHGVCYASYIVKTAEGRNELFSLFVQYFRKAPKVVVYDFGCALQEYCLNRLPDFFKHTLFVVDRLHWHNHSACSLGYCMNYYVRTLHRVNSVIAEQNNSALQKIKPTLSRTRQGPFMVLLRAFLSQWNKKKIVDVERHQYVAQLAY